MMVQKIITFKSKSLQSLLGRAIATDALLWHGMLPPDLDKISTPIRHNCEPFAVNRGRFSSTLSKCVHVLNPLSLVMTKKHRISGKESAFLFYFFDDEMC